MSSGTVALRLAIEGAVATHARRPIALPAYSCFDVAAAAVGARRASVLYDVDPSTLGPDGSSLRRALEHEPAAVVAAHLYGYPVDMECLARECRDARVMLIEDAAQGAGGSLRGAPLGSFGSLSVLSFGRGKGITAGGGGALLAHDDAGERVVASVEPLIAAASSGTREAVMLCAQWLFGRPSAYWLPAALPFLRLGETVYRDPQRPSAMSAAALGALHSSLQAHGAEASIRRAVAERLLRRARSSDRVRTTVTVSGASPGFLRLPLRSIREPAANVARRLGRHGVASGYPAALHRLHAFRPQVINARDDFDGANELADFLLTFPTHGLLGEADLAELEAWLG